MKHRICYLTPLPADYPMVGVKLRVEQMISAMRELDFVDLHVWRPEATSYSAGVRRSSIGAAWADLIVASLALTTPYLPQSVSSSTRDHIFSWLRRLEPELVLVSHPVLTALIPDLIRGGFGVVADTYNVEQANARQLMRLAKTPQELANALCQYAVMRNCERRLLPRAQEIWAASGQDVDQLRQIVQGRTAVAFVPNVVDTGCYTPTDNPEPNAVGFAASFGFFANEDAAEQLLRSILPALRETVPGVRLYLVGRDPSPKLCGMAAELPDVVVTGAVDDTRPWIARCTVVVAPIQYGSGTRLKILEALAMAKPVVSTAKGCEGLDVQDGTQLLVRDIQSFPSAVSSLLLDSSGARAMGRRGRALVAQKYSVPALRAILAERLGAILHSRRFEVGQHDHERLLPLD